MKLATYNVSPFTLCRTNYCTRFIESILRHPDPKLWSNTDKKDGMVVHGIPLFLLSYTSDLPFDLRTSYEKNISSFTFRNFYLLYFSLNIQRLIFPLM